MRPKHTDCVRVKYGKKLKLKDIETGVEEYCDLKKSDLDDLKEKTQEFLAERLDTLYKAQELLWANDNYALLVVFQGMDTAGKDGIIKHVFTALNPQGCYVTSFKAPTPDELDHDYLWRCSKELPGRGEIGIFNRSYYEEVIVTRVHKDLLKAERIPDINGDGDVWEKRYEDINAFEHHLVRNGTVILKFFLHISKEEQRKRLLDRLKDPEKWWKVSPSDFKEREYWGDYMDAYEQCLSKTSTKWAPWYVIPADQKWIARFMVADVLAETVKDLKLEYPRVSEENVRLISEIRKQLEKG